MDDRHLSSFEAWLDTVGPWSVSRLLETAPGGCVILGTRFAG